MSLDLKKLLDLAEEAPVFKQLVGDLDQGAGDVHVTTLGEAAPYFLAALFRFRRRPVLVVTAQPEEAKRLYEQLMNWCDADTLKIFPEPDALPYERIAAGDSAEMERVRVLSALAGMGGGAEKSSVVASLIVTSAPALAQKTVNYRDFIAAVQRHGVGRIS